MEDQEIKPILGAYSLNYFFGGKQVLKDISFELFKGEIITIIGPNASGKSTLLKILSGILPLKEIESVGQVFCQNRLLFKMTPEERARSVVYLSSELQAEFPLTALETVLMGRICHHLHNYAEKHDIARWAMEQCVCWGLRDRFLHTLSGGERQLVNLARALAQGSRVILLDEALSKMDLHHQTMMGMLFKKLVQKSYSIVLVSHDLNQCLSLADSCVLLLRGEKIAHGQIAEVFRDSHLKKLYPGASFVLGQNPTNQHPHIFL
ncbi:MAG: ABC transporter ATP-binding protein [Bdellovibrio sp.]|nr:ABC transporter ATP-binding protein [Bdellovibrio sp.]